MVDRLVNSEANSRRLTCVEQCFGASGQPLAVDGRVLVGEGVLTKVCRKKLKPRQFFLFNDILVYGNIVISKKKYNKQHVIPLEDVKLNDIPDESNNRNGWEVISPKKSFLVYAATAVEKNEWMSHIRKCVHDQLEKCGKTQSDEADCPVWVPDHNAPICMHCKKSQFSILNRRHHCRKCGKVVCNACSNQRWLLPQQSSKPLRICLTCFTELNLQSTKNAIQNVPDQYNYNNDSSESSSDEEEKASDSSSRQEEEGTFYEQNTEEKQ